MVAKIAIVGAGLVGKSLALSLVAKYRNISIKLYDPKPLMIGIKTRDYLQGRGLALNYSSIKILNDIGIWQNIKDNSYIMKQILVSQQGSFGRVNLQNNDHALGYVVPIDLLQKELSESIIANKNIIFNNAAIDKLTNLDADYIIIANGSNSNFFKTTIMDYEQDAYVTNVIVQHPKPGVAFERFTEGGTIAMLPFGGNRYKFIISRHASRGGRMFTPGFIQNIFGYRLGKILQVGEFFKYKLQSVAIAKLVHDNVVVMGNAATTLHPIAAQGFNLALRDIKAFTRYYANDLDKYNVERMQEHIFMRKTMGNLVDLFASDNTVLKRLRGWGLFAGDLCGPFKNWIIERTG